MTVRRDTAQRYKYQETGGDEHKPLLEGIASENGGRLREMGIWASYCYTWGIGCHHISGSIGSGTTEERTAKWTAANNDTADYTIRPVDLSATWEEWKDFTGDDRTEWLAAVNSLTPARDDGRDPVLQILRRCFPESRADLRAIDFTASPALATDSQLRRVLQIDPQATITEDQPPDAKPSVKRKLADCVPCSINRSMDLLVLGGDSLTALDQLRQSTGALKTEAVITTPSDAALLVREILRPTHREQQIGDAAVFTRRQVPEWFGWPVQF